MSLMGGFDLVAELSNETVLNLIRNTLTFEGQPLEPPFETEFDFPLGSVHMVVTGVQLDLLDDDTLTLTLPFVFGTIIFSTGLSLGPLSGKVTINAQVRGGASLTVNMSQATGALNLDAVSETELENDLSDAQTPFPVPTFISLVSSTLTERIRTAPDVSIPLPFEVVPSGDGQLTPSIQLTAAEVHCIGNADRDKQALAMFGMLMRANVGNGDHTQKTASAIASSSNGIAISLSPDAFNELVFKPATDGINPGGGMQIESLDATFADGHIEISGSATKSGFCYDARATFGGTLTLSASGTTFTADLETSEPSVDIDIPWYCYLAVGVVLGPLWAGVLAIIDATIESTLDRIGDIRATIDFGQASGVRVDRVDITNEGLTIQGWMSIPVTTRVKHSRLLLDGSVVTTDSSVIDTGTFEARTPCAPQPSDYEYLLYQQEQQAVYTLDSQLTVLPLTPVFKLEAGNHTVDLDQAGGSVEIVGVTTEYTMPLPSGTEVVRSVHIDYVIDDSQLRLFNTPTEGNYALAIIAQAKDINGDVVRGLDGNVLTTTRYIHFEGDRLGSPEWAAAMQTCMQQVRDKIVVKHVDRIPDIQLPPWVPVDYPVPEMILDFLARLVQLGIPEFDEIIVGARVAHGSSYTRAILSEQARTGFLGLADKRLEAAELGARLTAAASQVIANADERVLAELLRGMNLEK